MNIALFGATGGTGSRILEESLNRGYTVRALVRNPAKLTMNHPRLTVIQGDMSKLDDVSKTLDGVEAVISTAGPVKGSDPFFLLSAVENVVKAMVSRGLKRLVWLTGAGVVDARDGKDFMRPLIKATMKIAAGKVLRASESAYRDLIKAPLDTTVVRAPILSDAPGGKTLEAGYVPPKPRPISRADLAVFMLDCLPEDRWIGESPMVGYPS